MAALRASRLVCSAMSSIVSTMAPICSLLAPSSVTLAALASTASLIRPMPLMVFWTAARPSAAADAARADASPTSADALPAALMNPASLLTAAEEASTRVVVSAAPAPTWPMTPVSSCTDVEVAEAAWACSWAPAATWLMVLAICPDAWPDWFAASVSWRLRRATSSDADRTSDSVAPSFRRAIS